MDDLLLPAIALFAKWFIRFRWIALIVLVSAGYIVKNLFGVSIQDNDIYYLSVLLLVLNVVHTFIIKRITLKGGKRIIQKIKNEVHFQIISDLIILTLVIHFSGGIENPLILFYFMHMIIASAIFSTLESFLHALFSLFLVALLTFLEYYSVIPHYHLDGYFGNELYRNSFFIFATGFVYVCTSVALVSISHMIIFRSIKSEESYVKTNQELENKDKLKNEYVLRVTHDIKGHLAAILSCIKVIKSRITGPLNQMQEEFANRAYERTELLTDFVKDLLNLTNKRLKHDLEFEEFSIRDIINKVLVPVNILVRDKSIQLNLFFDETIGTLKGNPFMIEELYSNLLLNAVKYTADNGIIGLSVRNRHDHIITEISDSGIGIPAEDLPRVFDEFFRAGNVPKDFKTGSGLGLSIVKQIVENHKGRIWVSSEVAKGTKFTFTLPKNPAVS
jgi:signal transduction histidine kinase